MGAGVAFVLVWLIGTITNLTYYHRLSSSLVSPAANHPAGARVERVQARSQLLCKLMFTGSRLVAHRRDSAMYMAADEQLLAFMETVLGERTCLPPFAPCWAFSQAGGLDTSSTETTCISSMHRRSITTIRC